MCQHEGVGYGCGHNQLHLLTYCHAARNAFQHICLKPPDVVQEWDILDENCNTCISNDLPKQRNTEPEPLLELPQPQNPMTFEQVHRLAKVCKAERQKLQLQQKLARQQQQQQKQRGSADDDDGNPGSSGTKVGVYLGVIDIPPFKYTAPDQQRAEEVGADTMDIDELQTNNVKKRKRVQRGSTVIS
jgi:hypothetical protein